MEYRQISRDVFVPERTAAIADKHPGVKSLLLSGFKVLSYMDEREMVTASIVPLPVKAAEDIPLEEQTLSEKWDEVKERIKEKRERGEQ